jgi:hypothetical protein
MMYVRFPLSLRNLEDLLHERGIDNRLHIFVTEKLRSYGAVMKAMGVQLCEKLTQFSETS